MVSKAQAAAVLLVLLAASFADGKCTINGRDAPDSECNSLFAGIGIVWLAVMCVLLLVIAVGLAFWLWMLVDCIRRDFTEKTKWLAIIILLNTVGALAYFFLVKRKK